MRAHRALAALGGALAVALRAAAPLGAQQTAATLAGRVVDAATDSALAGAFVFVSGTLLHARTDAHGAYRLDGIAPGAYTVRIVMLGYRPVVRDSVSLAAGAPRRLDVAMARAAVQLAPVSVTASQVERSAGQSVASVSVMSREDITSRDVVNLDEALPYVGGVTFNHGQIDLRGASGASGGVGSRVLVLLDGHPVLSADGSETDFQALPVMDVDRVEVVKGAYSAVYGSNALGGVVNIVTTPIGRDPVTTVRAHYGAYDVPSALRFASGRLSFKGIAAEHSRRIGPVGLRLYVGRDVSAGYEQDDSASHWLYSGKLVFPMAAGRLSSAYATYSSENDGNFFVWRDAQHPYEAPAGTAGDWAHYGKLSAGATLIPIAGQRSLLQITPYYEHDASQNHFAGNRDYHRASRLGTGLQYTLAPDPDATLIVGADASHTDITSDILGRPAGDTSTAFVGQPRLEDYGLYAQAERRLGDRLTGSAGTRLDVHHATGGATERSLSPKLGLAYRLSRLVSARASVGHGYRAPAAIEQFVSTSQYGFQVVPNPSLHGERAWSAEVGATVQPRSWLWVDGAIFQSWYHDLIGPAPAPGLPFVFQFRNTTRARVRGLDLETKIAAIPDRLSLDLTYLYLDTRDETNGGPLPYRSPNNLTATIEALRGLAAVDVRYRSRVQEVLAYPLDPRGAITVVDLRLAYRVLGTIVQAKAANLFQARYVDVMERNLGAPRSLMLTAQRSF